MTVLHMRTRSVCKHFVWPWSFLATFSHAQSGTHDVGVKFLVSESRGIRLPVFNYTPLYMHIEISAFGIKMRYCKGSPRLPLIT